MLTNDFGCPLLLSSFLSPSLPHREHRFSQAAVDAVVDCSAAGARGQQVSDHCGDLGPVVELLSAAGEWLHRLQVRVT